MAKKKCIDCNNSIKPWFKRCYPCHERYTRETGIIGSLISFIYLPSIPTILILSFGEAFKNIGMSNFLLILFWLASTIILILIKFQELKDLFEKIKKGKL